MEWRRRCWFPWEQRRGQPKALKQRLFFLAVESVAFQKGIELFQFNPVLLKLLILGAEVTRWGFPLRPCFCAFENDLLTHRNNNKREGGWGQGFRRFGARSANRLTPELAWAGGGRRISSLAGPRLIKPFRMNTSTHISAWGS